jgi:hypothetical protein
MKHALIAAMLGCGVAVTGVGCSGSNGSPGTGALQSGNNGTGGGANASVGGGCSLGPPQTVGPNDITPLGTPATLLAAITGTHLATLTWGTPTAQPNTGQSAVGLGGNDSGSAASASTSGNPTGASEQGTSCMAGTGLSLPRYRGQSSTLLLVSIATSIQIRSDSRNRLSNAVG